ncbi:L-serine ammonia-lyase, iron-sulfur-dependent subunit beta [Paenibacillus hamazuiensis]|uniref:L-serine ammonia-lyase, iron-sulfur-dependent subunit beta n=1 Tax=Paenibacillus hamazuiensis TaxID=2936508 RepID=UPI00201099FD|nr:L-serine ammonia-lyase, iron-sulfur-dependent subunit beta [Paenibacillus hamazuiensis]
MRFKDVFSIIGPAMVGPSSSHTAGAVRLGRVARELLGCTPERADIAFFGSFADTYRGHGTDLAVAAGLLGCDTDDMRIPQSLELAVEAGMQVFFRSGRGLAAHPNTAEIRLIAGDREVHMRGASIGGGNIEIENVNGFDVRFSAMYPTLLVFHADRPGMIAAIAGMLGRENINIGSMDLDRKGRSGAALTAIESDSGFAPELLERLSALSDVTDVRVIDITEGGR